MTLLPVQVPYLSALQSLTCLSIKGMGAIAWEPILSDLHQLEELNLRTDSINADLVRALQKLSVKCITIDEGEHSLESLYCMAQLSCAVLLTTH